MTSEMSDTTNKWVNCDSLLLFLVVVTRLTFRAVSFSPSEHREKKGPCKEQQKKRALVPFNKSICVLIFSSILYAFIIASPTCNNLSLFFVFKPPTSQYSTLSKTGTQISSFLFFIKSTCKHQIRNMVGKHVYVPPDFPSQKLCRPHVSSHSLMCTLHGISNCTAHQTVLLRSAQ